MGRNTWWVTIAVCFTALAALQVNGSPEDPVEQFNGTTSTTEMPQYDEILTDDMEIDEEEDDNVLGLDDDTLRAIEDDIVSGGDNDTDDGNTFQGRDFMDTNPTVIGGQPVLEGDIAMTASQWRNLRDRKAMKSIFTRWRTGSDGNPYVPFRFGDKYVSRTAVVDGLKHWRSKTCIKFRYTSNPNQPHLIFIKGSGCWSYIGRLNRNGQPISIGSGCTSRGIIAHEIGHAIGFFHEQSRPDRDKYVRILKENLYSQSSHNFRKSYAINTYGVVYDYNSVMHYSPMAFSRNGRRTIVARYQWAQYQIGQRRGLSHRDKLLANLMYGCINKWLKKCGLTKNPCQDDGYVGKNCRCVCRPGTYGNRCEK